LRSNTDLKLMRALSPSPVRTACLMHSSLMTGSMPGMAASTSETCELGSPPNAVAAPENSFDCEVTWAWISMPMTTSQSPLAPLMSLDCISAALLDAPAARRARCTALVRRFGEAPQGCRNLQRLRAQEPATGTGVGLTSE